MGKALKFRIWDCQSKRFVASSSQVASGWALDAFCGELIHFERVNAGESDPATYSIFFDPKHHSDGLDIMKANRYVLSQFTGLTDMHAKEVYEGDLICFTDPGKWLGGGSQEPGEYKKLGPLNTLIGRVTRDTLTTNLTLEVLEPCGVTHLPLTYAQGENAKIIGNIFEPLPNGM